MNLDPQGRRRWASRVGSPQWPNRKKAASGGLSALEEVKLGRQTQPRAASDTGAASPITK